MNFQSITPKISPHGLINKYEQFNLNYSTIHIFSQKYFVNTIHMNSETLGLLFTANHQTSVPLCEPEFIVISCLTHITIQIIVQFIPLTTQTVRGLSRIVQFGSINFHTLVPSFGTDQTIIQGLKPTETSTKYLNQE